MPAPQKLSLNQFLGRCGLSRPPAEHGFLRATSSMSAAALKRAQKWHRQALVEYGIQREAAIAAYNALVEAGEIVDPDQTERLERKAQGHPDNDSVQAARRVLEKRKARQRARETRRRIDEINDELFGSPLGYGG
jgi:HD superfamily phosphodiesterase